MRQTQAEMLRAPLPFPRLGRKNLSLHVLWFLARPTLPFFLPFALRLRRRVGKLAHALPGGLILDTCDALDKSVCSPLVGSSLLYDLPFLGLLIGISASA